MIPKSPFFEFLFFHTTAFLTHPFHPSRTLLLPTQQLSHRVALLTVSVPLTFFIPTTVDMASMFMNPPPAHVPMANTPIALPEKRVCIVFAENRLSDGTHSQCSHQFKRTNEYSTFLTDKVLEILGGVLAKYTEWPQPLANGKLYHDMLIRIYC
jgi:hypothetical protein